MEIIYKKLDEIRPYANNPRSNDNAVDAVAESIKEFGFKQPIVIDVNDEIVAGHTRLKAAKKLGLKEVPCILADDLTPEEVKAYRLADNKVAELAGWDFEMLDSELLDIDSIDMSSFGFDEIHIDFDQVDKKGKYNDARIGELKDRFLVPPFSVINSTVGYWIERKRMWEDIGINRGAEETKIF